MTKEVVAGWNEVAQSLAERFWPGPLTLVIPKHSQIPYIVTAGLETVGVRVPAHPIAQRLIEEAGVPIAAPSANRFTGLSPTRAEHVRQSLGAGVDLILDGGPTRVGIESTVLSLTGDRPVLLRPGMITRRAIEEIIGPVDQQSSAEGPNPAPGMHPRHYSPRTPLTVSSQPPEGKIAWMWWNREDLHRRSVRMPDTAERYAACLYDTLHSLDLEGWDWIVVEPVPDDAEWDGIRDRLRRAAER